MVPGVASSGPGLTLLDCIARTASLTPQPTGCRHPINMSSVLTSSTRIDARARSRSARHLPFMHRARAIAIVWIVSMHCVGALDWSSNPHLYRFLVELFQGSTVLFFMISGYLFQHLSDQFDYVGYLGNKFRHVILPYLVVSTPGIVLLLTKPEFAIDNPELAQASWWVKALFLYFYGGAQLNHVLWFVAVVAIYYLFAPVFVHVLRHPRWFALLLVLLPISLLAHRTTTQKYHHLQLALYFLSAYMSGMAAGLYAERILAFVNRYMVWFIGLFVALFAGHLMLTDYVGSYVDEIFSSSNGLIDWIFLQKFVLFFVLIALLQRVDRQRMDLVDHLATVSFAIYFLHIYVLHVYSHFVHWTQFPGSLASFAMLLAMSLGGSVAIAYLCRRVFGHNSRMLIGA